MLHSTFNHKNTNEDSRTSAVFENLILLPDNVFWFLLRESCFSNVSMPYNCGKLLSYEFWPHWDMTGTVNEKYVEPDLFIRFEGCDVIIEAKYGEHEGQNENQWRKEIIAYHNEYESGKTFVFIAVGGNQSTEAETINVKDEMVQIYKCNWLSLLMNVKKYQRELEGIFVPDMNVMATSRLLEHIILAFNINGVYNIDWFDTLAHSKRLITEDSLGNLDNHFNWLKYE